MILNQEDKRENGEGGLSQIQLIRMQTLDLAFRATGRASMMGNDENSDPAGIVRAAETFERYIRGQCQSGSDELQPASLQSVRVRQPAE